ncbi:MAG: hypothetical protein N3E51_00160 [Candidatus Micrarchaeota archaeon]|nr:hypothetical protein [Candidatus Micrarchaeota archaeon]
MGSLRKIITSWVFLLFIVNFAFAADPTSMLKNALSQLCEALRDLVPIAAMLMVLLSAVIYAVGQMMGAETRARANVWSTSCLTGALVGLLISTIAPAVLSIIAGTTIDC